MVWHKHTHRQTHAHTQMCVCVCEGAVPITSGCAAILFAGCCIPTCGGDTSRHIAIFWKPQSCNPSRKLKNSHMCPWHPSMKSSYPLMVATFQTRLFPTSTTPRAFREASDRVAAVCCWDILLEHLSQGGPGGPGRLPAPKSCYLFNKNSKLLYFEWSPPWHLSIVMMYCDDALWRCFVMMFCDNVLWSYFVMMYCDDALWKWSVIMICDDALWWCIVMMFCENDLW